jgi:hypothetical protein
LGGDTVNDTLNLSQYEDAEIIYQRRKEGQGATHQIEANETQKTEEKIPVSKES